MKIKNIFLLLIFLSFSTLLYASSQPKEKFSYDVILIIENSKTMRTLNKEVIKFFIDTLEENNCLGIIYFEKEAKVAFPLQSLLTDKEKNLARDSLEKLSFKSKFRDVNNGLQLALSEFKDHGRKDASKMVLLFSGGKIHPQRKRKAFIKELRENILPAYRADNIVVNSLVYRKADLQLMQEIAHKTNGKCFFINNNEILADILSLISERMQPLIMRSVEKVPVQTVIKEVQTTISPQLILVLVFIGVLLILTLVNFHLVLTNNRILNNVYKPSVTSKTKGQDTSSFIKLRESTNQMSNILTDIVSRFNNFQLDIEDYGAQNWEREKESKQKYYQMVDSLFLLLDYLEDVMQSEKKSDEISWFYNKTCRILDEQGISEIAVKAGEPFNGIYHKHVGDRPGRFSKGAILELSRKGYMVRGQTGKDDIVLRQAEVVVSNKEE